MNIFLLYILCHHTKGNPFTANICRDNMAGMQRRKLAAMLIALACATGAKAWPKIGSDVDGFLPSKNYPQPKDQLAMESGSSSVTPSISDKAGRFGFPTYATDVNNFPQTVNNVVPGLYGPVKLDIGGLVLGTIIGLGAFFVLPKIFHVLAAPTGGYKRSEDEPEGNALNELTRRISEGIDSMNLDTTACLQRAICSSMQTPAIAGPIVDPIAKNNIVKSLLAGSDWQRAITIGSKGESCGTAFPKCPFSAESLMKPLMKFFSTT